MPRQAQNLEELSRVNLELVPLDEIALYIAKDHYPDLDTKSYLERLNEFARRAARRCSGMVGEATVAQALSHYLFDEEGFRGNKTDYYNPSNNFFNDVLDQRTGMPIMLCILYIAIGQRLGLPVSGVSFPGHFLVHYKSKKEHFYVDAFSSGKLLSKEDCEKRLAKRYGDEFPMRPEFFRPSSHREILLRILSNLKMSYMLRKEYENVLQVLSNILIFTPEGAEELKQRGLIYFHLECFQSALQDLESYLSKMPRAPDRDEIEACLTDLRERVSQIS